jgi:tetratricopeptide (TPR) repeat protein
MIATFYSFKGGVGRSMAVANVADLLARQGLRVLVVDFDLEAPGLEQYFQIDHKGARRGPGLLDLLLSYKQWMSVSAMPGEEPAFRRLDDFILPVYARLPGGGCLDLLQAGRREPKEAMDQYVASLRSFDWQDFYFNWDGELFFEYLRTQLAPPRYDLVIVDSRTGVTEMGGICTYQLADVIVLFTAANHQNRRGTLDYVRDIETLPLAVARRDRPLQMLVVPARVEQRDPALLEKCVTEFESLFGERMPPALRAANVTFKDLLIPYEPAYAFEERVLSEPNRADERRGIASAFERLAQAVKLMLPATAQAAEAADVPTGISNTVYDAARRFAGYDVFVSCGAADADGVRPLVEYLEKRVGVAVFFDRREMVASEDWRARTAHALFHSKVCLVCYGVAGQSRAAVDELIAAAEGAIGSHDLPIVPVMLPGASYERFLAALPTKLARTAFLDLRDGIESTLADAAIRKMCAPEAPQPDQPASAVASQCPYPGARPFTEADSPFFFGRGGATTAIVEALDAHKWIVVTGASGCGKTSTVQGGVVPQLRSRASAAGATLTVRQLTGGCSRTEVDAAIADLERAGGQALCVVDHLERFVRGQAASEMTAAFTRLANAARSGSIRMIMVCRDARQNEVRELAPAGFLDGDHVVPIYPLTQAQLRDIIEKPAECAGLAFEPGLVERLLADWALDQRFLLFMQIVLQDLWNRRREGFLTNRGYDESPDPVAEWAERAFAALSPELQKCAALVLPRLSTLCDNLTPIGRYCRREELLVSAVSDVQLRALIGSLIDSTLVYSVADADGRPQLAPTYLVEQWPRAEAWMEEQARFQEWLAPFAVRRTEYARSGGSPEFLLSGELLVQAEKQPTEWLTHDEVSFITMSRGAATSERRHRFGGRLAVVIVAAVIAASTLMSRSNRNRENESDAGAFLQLSRNLEAQARYAEAAQGLDRAEKLYADAGKELDVLIVQLERSRNKWQQGRRAEAATLFDATIGKISTSMDGVRAPLVDVSRFFYTQNANALAVKGLDLAWRMSGHRSSSATDLTGHRLSLALAATHQYALAQAAYSEAVDGASREAIDTANNFYFRTINDAPGTTQAVDNMARLLVLQDHAYEAVLLLDDRIASASTDDPQSVPWLRRTRRDLLKTLKPADLRKDRPMGHYVCQHNTHVYVMSVRSANVAQALTQVRGRYPLAEAGPPLGDWVPIIADFFLTCAEAEALIAREAKNGQAPFAGGWYRSCQLCPGLSAPAGQPASQAGSYKPAY